MASITQFRPSSILLYVAGRIRSIYQKSYFGIKRGYIHRNVVIPHDDRGYTDEYQKEVYERAFQWMQQHQLSSVIDIGSGSGYKLIKYLGQYHTLGVDIDPAISNAAIVYPHHQWINALHFVPTDYATDIILCADTIEHIADPNEFMKSILSIQHWKYMLISTPERNSKRGKFHYGPSPNPSHYREWSKQEFIRFISTYTRILHWEMTNVQQGTQLIICRNPSLDQ